MKIAFRGDAADALGLFARAPVIHLATADDAGGAIVRTVHGVLIDGAIAFHGGDHGDKLELIDRAAVATAEEIIAEIPSYFIDPERACPATTYYRSAHASGRIHRVLDVDRKARIVAALMQRYQPEGGYAPIDARDPRYATAVATLLVAELVIERLSAKNKLGQNRKPDQIERILAQLWRRGRPGDVRAIRVIREAHPARPLPAFLRGPGSVELCCAPDQRDARAASALLATQYWNAGVSEQTIAQAQLGASAWVVARREGELIGTARANSDGARCGHILDVVVAPHAKGQGVGKALLALLLDHPRLRSCRVVRLNTRDAQPFYAPFGFVQESGQYPEMTLKR